MKNLFKTKNISIVLFFFITLSIIIATPYLSLASTEAEDEEDSRFTPASMSLNEAIGNFIKALRILLTVFLIMVVSVSIFFFTISKENPYMLNIAKSFAFWGAVGFMTGLIAFIILFAIRSMV